MATRIQDWAERVNLLLDTQSGFRRARSTIDNIFIIDTIIQNYIKPRNGILFSIFVDFQRAFDGICGEKLWYKLSLMGMSEKVITMLRSIYQQVHACVKVASQYITDRFMSEIGLRQGDNLSGMLFLMYVYDITDFMVENGDDPITIGQLYLTVLLFADDLCILAKIAESLQRKIYYLSKYCKLWDLKINVGKSQVVA